MDDHLDNSVKREWRLKSILMFYLPATLAVICSLIIFSSNVNPALPFGIWIGKCVGNGIFLVSMVHFAFFQWLVPTFKRPVILTPDARRFVYTFIPLTLLAEFVWEVYLKWNFLP